MLGSGPARRVVAATGFSNGWSTILQEFNRSWSLDPRLISHLVRENYDVNARSNLEFRRFLELEIDRPATPGPVLGLEVAADYDQGRFTR